MQNIVTNITVTQKVKMMNFLVVGIWVSAQNDAPGYSRLLDFSQDSRIGEKQGWKNTEHVLWNCSVLQSTEQNTKKKFSTEHRTEFEKRSVLSSLKIISVIHFKWLIINPGAYSKVGGPKPIRNVCGFLYISRLRRLPIGWRDSKQNDSPIELSSRKSPRKLDKNCSV